MKRETGELAIMKGGEHVRLCEERERDTGEWEIMKGLESGEHVRLCEEEDRQTIMIYWTCLNQYILT